MDLAASTALINADDGSRGLPGVHTGAPPRIVSEARSTVTRGSRCCLRVGASARPRRGSEALTTRVHVLRSSCRSHTLNATCSQHANAACLTHLSHPAPFGHAQNSI